MSGGRETDFVARWSRRKEAARSGVSEAEPAVTPASDSTPAPASADERGDAEILAELGLPDPDSLRPGADFRAFMAAAVPARIRNRALRVLWRSDPRLAALDGLVDHGEDFTDAGTVKTGMASAYRVGQGMLRRLSESPDATDDTSGPARPEPPAAQPAMEAAEGDPAGDPDPADPPPPRPAATAAPAPRRRMKFVVIEANPETDRDITG